MDRWMNKDKKIDSMMKRTKVNVKPEERKAGWKMKKKKNCDYEKKISECNK